MKYLITGANGSAAYYLGQILENWYPLSRPECDLTDFPSVCRGLEYLEPDVIFHMASDANVRKSFDTARETIHNNVTGTVNLFEACRYAHIKPTIVICSTSEVYGNPGRHPITEDFPLDPVNPYAVSKTTQDLLGAMYERAYSFRVVRTRAFGYVNPRRRDLSLSHFASQVVAVERGEAEEIRHGNLDSVRTFCDVRDIARAYKLSSGLSGVFNIGSERPVSIGDCLEILCSKAKVKVRTKEDPSLLRPTDVTNQIPDCSKFRKATGWEPEIPLEDSLEWLLTNFRSAS